MRHNHLKTRIWLALAVAIASLGFASSASARLVLDDRWDPSVAPQVPAVVMTGGGFNWADAAVGAGAALGVALCCIVLALLARNRTRLAT